MRVQIEAHGSLVPCGFVAVLWLAFNVLRQRHVCCSIATTLQLVLEVERDLLHFENIFEREVVFFCEVWLLLFDFLQRCLHLFEMKEHIALNLVELTVGDPLRRNETVPLLVDGYDLAAPPQLKAVLFFVLDFLDFATSALIF